MSAQIVQFSSERLDELKGFSVMDIEGTQSWREGKAVEYPDDARNQRAAIELTKLAEYMRALPSNHRLFRLELQVIDAEKYSGTVIEEKNELVRRYGFYRQEEPQSFVDELIALYEKCLAILQKQTS